MKSAGVMEITPVVPLTLRGIKRETALILERELAG
jgi:hypothetical protein